MNLKNIIIRERLKLLLLLRSKKWFEIYQPLKIKQSIACLYFNGDRIPSNLDKIRIASQLNVDAFLIWGDLPDG